MFLCFTDCLLGKSDNLKEKIVSPLFNSISLKTVFLPEKG